MPKLEDSAAGYFQVDSTPYQKGSVRPVVKGNNFGLTVVATGAPLVAPVPFGDWTNGVDAAYGSIALLLVDIRAFCFQI